jgi:hypothetical protein
MVPSIQPVTQPGPQTTVEKQDITTITYGVFNMTTLVAITWQWQA